MIKKATALIMVGLLLLLSFVPSFGRKHYLVDSAGLFDIAEQQVLDEMLSDSSDELGFDIVVLTVNDANSVPDNRLADDYFDNNGYGRGEDRDGCLLLIDMNTRYMYISTRGYGITAITDYGVEHILDEIEGYMADKDYFGAVETYAETVKKLVLSAREGNIYDINNAEKDRQFNPIFLVVGVVIGLISAFAVSMTLKSKLKTVMHRSEANDYLEKDSVNITDQSDDFIGTHIQRTARPKNNSSSGGGGSSIHTSSSGASHGGGGRSF